MTPEQHKHLCQQLNSFSCAMRYILGSYDSVNEFTGEVTRLSWNEPYDNAARCLDFAEMRSSR